MEIFLDTSKVEEIEKWLNQGIIDGVTTNPSILLKDGSRDLKASAKKIASLIHPRPLSVEVCANDLKEMLRQGREFSSWLDNIVVKIPVINEYGTSCLGVVKELENSGIKVNCTACLSFGQALLAAKAGASYISLFAGRISDEGGDPADIVRKTKVWLDMWNYKSKIIVGSIRTIGDIQQTAAAGAHVLTIPPEFLSKLVDHKYTRFTVQQFVNDGKKALEAEVELVKVAQ